LKPGDEVTIGAVTLRVAKLGQEAPVQPGSAASKPKAADTAVVEAIAVEEEEEEFEMEFDDGELEPVVEGIPLADDQPTQLTERKPNPKVATAGKSPNAPTDTAMPTAKPKADKEDDAIAEFLLDLHLDDDEE